MTNYTYDNGSRLLNLDHLNPLNEILEKISYDYDSNGNRTKMDRQNMPVKLPAPASNTSYNAANQMLSFNDKNITYDGNGNMTTVTNSCGTTNYSWDARNRLIGINGFNADCLPLTASFKYDARGRRIEKTVNGKTTNYLYDGLDIVQEIEDGTVTANYIRTLNIDEPLARIKSDGTIRFYERDGLGSVISLTDETGIIKTQYNYDQFGNTEMIGETSDNPFQYTGRENDGTGLYYYRGRYYSPELQRFISEDPIGLRGGINKYAYVGNNPVNAVDPFGLESCTGGCHPPGSPSTQPPSNPTPSHTVPPPGDPNYGPPSPCVGSCHPGGLPPTYNGPPDPNNVLSTVAPFVAAVVTTYLTDNAKLGGLAYDLTGTLIGLLSGKPAGIPKVPIDPIINPPSAY